MAKTKDAKGYWKMPKPPKAPKGNSTQSQINKYNADVAKWEAECDRKHSENETLRKSREAVEKKAQGISGGYTPRKSGGKKRR